MSGGKVVDLSLQFALSPQASGLLKRARSVGRLVDDLLPVLATLKHEEQRFLAAIIAWRIEGGRALPASDLLNKLPALHGLEFGSIQATAERLDEAGVIEVVPVDKDGAGNVTAVGFIWPAFEKLLLLSEQRDDAPMIVGPGGAPIR